MQERTALDTAQIISHLAILSLLDLNQNHPEKYYSPKALEDLADDDIALRGPLFRIKEKCKSLFSASDEKHHQTFSTETGQKFLPQSVWSWCDVVVSKIFQFSKVPRRH